MNLYKTNRIQEHTLKPEPGTQEPGPQNPVIQELWTGTLGPATQKPRTLRRGPWELKLWHIDS